MVKKLFQSKKKRKLSSFVKLKYFVAALNSDVDEVSLTKN